MTAATNAITVEGFKSASPARFALDHDTTTASHQRQNLGMLDRTLRRASVQAGPQLFGTTWGRNYLQTGTETPTRRVSAIRLPETGGSWRPDTPPLTGCVHGRFPTTSASSCGICLCGLCCSTVWKWQSTLRGGTRMFSRRGFTGTVPSIRIIAVSEHFGRAFQLCKSTQSASLGILLHNS